MSQELEQRIRELEERLGCYADAEQVIQEAGRALEISEARFRGLFDKMRSGVAVYQPSADGLDFVLVDFNRFAEQLSGRQKADLAGRSVKEIFPGVSDSGLLGVFQRVWQSGESEGHSTYKYKDEELVSWWNNYVHKLPSGEIIVVHDDITERKKAEAKLFVYQEQLQSLTSELSLAEERERRRLATDLHDQIGQNLSVIKMRMSDLRENLGAADIGARLDAIRELLNQTIQETRSLTFELSPPILYELGLDAALEWLAENFQAKHGLSCRFSSDSREKPLDDDVSVVLFRSARELLANVFKHARAREVRVSCRRDRDRVRILVEDDGAGFAMDREKIYIDRTMGFGLFNIRERLERLGGYLDIESEPGHGARVEIAAPLKTAENNRKEIPV